MKIKLKRNYIIALVTLVIIISIFGFYFFNIATETCAGCEPCKYGTFSEKAFISKYDFDENDSLIQVNFTIKGQRANDAMWLNGARLYEIGIDNFTREKLNDTSIYYIVSGKRIYKGTCQPYLIQTISLDQ